MLGVRDVSGFRVWAQYQASNTRSVAELRTVCPFLDQRRLDVVVPATPVIPRDEDDGAGPQATLDDGIDLVRRPFLAGPDGLDGVLAQSFGTVEPGGGRQVAGGCVPGELLRGDVLLAALQSAAVSVSVATVIPPGQSGFLQRGGKGRNVEGWLLADGVPIVWVVDDG